MDKPGRRRILKQNGTPTVVYKNDPKVQALVETTESPEFKAVLERLGGYDTRETGVQRTLP